MPRPAAITPNKSLHTTLNADLAAKLDLLLYSEVEQRVPKGAYQEFLQARIQEYFSTRRIDLATLIPGMPGSTSFRHASSPGCALRLHPKDKGASPCLEPLAIQLESWEGKSHQRHHYNR